MLGSTELVDVDGLQAAVVGGRIRVLDVRQELEWRHGHVLGATNVDVVELPSRVEGLRAPTSCTPTAAAGTEPP